ncbi:TetR family transcriptional regulator [Actinomycetospora endophytica]|uniref:TetR family transcriptional regulator n=1 Tax=Actinomycetospora endophytica TaxID=2291215 RepID=A0ABS8PEW4_9PSEU|nr:TetR family transcriptional regulator [Actinomycetospora endophytica]MCD2196699.1 TetR family transcriptional regulator [Actinomycetospora endophytica]
MAPNSTRRPVGSIPWNGPRWVPRNLARDGVAGCTARAVADASPLTKSAIHYYFRDIDEIVDAAVAAHLEAMLTGLREVARSYTDPEQRLRAVVTAYLDTFAERPYAAFLWFEHWIAAGRRGERASTEGMLTSVESLFDELLAAARPVGARQDSRALVSWLLGTVVQQHVRPLDAAELGAEVGRILGAVG